MNTLTGMKKLECQASDIVVRRLKFTQSMPISNGQSIYIYIFNDKQPPPPP